MSAESDLLFPQVDSFMLSDLSNFSEYEDFSRDVFLISEIDGFALLDELDCKEGLKPLLLSELNELSCSLEGIKEEDEEDMRSAKVGSPKGCARTSKGELRGPLHAVPDMDNGLRSESEAEMVLTSDEISCMSLEDTITRPNTGELWHASPFEHTTSTTSDCLESGVSLEESMPSLPLPTQGDTHIYQSSDMCVTPKRSATQIPESSPLQCSLITTGKGMHAEKKRASITASIFHINSPLSSPSSSVSTPEGSTMLKMFGHEEKGSLHHPSLSINQPATFVDSGLLSPQAEGCHRAIPHCMMQDGSGFATMHRSQSSHALGQFRMSGHLGACPEEFNVSSTQVSPIGYSSPNNFTHYQATSSSGSAERSAAFMPMRRVFSAGDIQACNGMQICYGDNNLGRLERVNSEGNMGLKVGHYTLEERKMRLHRYRQKRNERNFSKKIKYACRKTLADSRPRIRGRFARTLDDFGEPLVKENGVSYDDEYEEVDVPSAHCSMPHNRAVSFWNATGMNATIQHGH